MQLFFTSLLGTIKKSFTSYYGMPHILAVLGTYVIVMTNFDWYYFIHMRASNILTSVFSPAIVIGGIVPILIPFLTILLGYVLKNKKTVIIGWTFAQAMILGSFISSTYKFFTGRVQPNTHDLLTNISHGFNFGFDKHGIFWGWPSSHTTIAFAMAFSLIQLFPKNRLVQVLALLYAFYIGIGISFSIHWFSEFFAGALIGSVIGIMVGNNFKNTFLYTVNNDEKFLS